MYTPFTAEYSQLELLGVTVEELLTISSATTIVAVQDWLEILDLKSLRPTGQ